jgi:hypothetical protein
VIRLASMTSTQLLPCATPIRKMHRQVSGGGSCGAVHSHGQGNGCVGSDTKGLVISLVLCCRVAEENAAVRGLAARGADALQQMARQLAGASCTHSVNSCCHNITQSLHYCMELFLPLPLLLLMHPKLLCFCVWGFGFGTPVGFGVPASCVS